MATPLGNDYLEPRGYPALPPRCIDVRLGVKKSKRGGKKTKFSNHHPTQKKSGHMAIALGNDYLDPRGYPASPRRCIDICPSCKKKSNFDFEKNKKRKNKSVINTPAKSCFAICK